MDANRYIHVLFQVLLDLQTYFICIGKKPLTRVLATVQYDMNTKPLDTIILLLQRPANSILRLVYFLAFTFGFRVRRPELQVPPTRTLSPVLASFSLALKPCDLCSTHPIPMLHSQLPCRHIIVSPRLAGLIPLPDHFFLP